MKRNDTRPFLDVTLTDIDGTAMDLTSAQSVTFTMKDSDTNEVKVNSQACTFVDQAGGAVRYSWAPVNTDTAGTYLGEFEITYGVDDRLTVPTQGVLTIAILEDYNG